MFKHRPDLTATFVFLLLIFIIGGSVLLTGCEGASINVPSMSTTTTTTLAAPLPTVTVPAQPTARPALTWERTEKLKGWSKILYSAIDNHWTDLRKVTDMKMVCPGYDRATEEQKKYIWAEVFVNTIYFECSYDETSWMIEKSMGKDPVTGRQVRSEGPFQLSYQDESWAKCGFDWSKDKLLHDDDPNKTIFNPDLNIRCGVKIMAMQVAKTKLGNEAFLKEPYWAVLREPQPGRFSKIPEIKSIMAKLPICR